MLEQDGICEIAVASLQTWIIPNVHGFDRLFVDVDIFLSAHHLDAIWYQCAGSSLVLTSAHPILLRLARANEMDYHFFRWTHRFLKGGAASIRWMSATEFPEIHRFHLWCRGDPPSSVDRWASALDAEEHIIGIVAQVASTSNVGFVSSLLVHPEWRRKGVGSSLMIYALNDHLSSRQYGALIHRAGNLPSQKLCD